MVANVIGWLLIVVLSCWAEDTPCTSCDLTLDDGMAEFVNLQVPQFYAPLPFSLTITLEIQCDQALNSFYFTLHYLLFI